VSEPKPVYTVTKTTVENIVELVQAIIAYKVERGYAPTSIELAEILGICQPAANDRIRRAVEKGVITKPPRQMRAITLRGEKYVPPVWASDVEAYVKYWIKVGEK